MFSYLTKREENAVAWFMCTERGCRVDRARALLGPRQRALRFLAWGLWAKRPEVLFGD